MKVLILGATGRTGKHLLANALKAGYQVNVLVRDKNKVKINHPQLTIFEGNTLDKELLAKALQDCTYLVSALNISRTSDFPWAKLRTPENFLSSTLQRIIELADEKVLKQLVIITAWGVHETLNHIPFWFKWMIQKSNIGIAYKDHEIQEDLLKKSGLNFTVVRPVVLTNAKTIGIVKVSYNNQPKPSLTISRKRLAQFIISILGNKEYFNQLPTLSQA